MNYSKLCRLKQSAFVISQFPRVTKGLRRVFLTQGLTWSSSQDGGKDCGQLKAWLMLKDFFPRMLPHCGWGLTSLLGIGSMPKFQIRWTSSQNCLSVFKMWQLSPEDMIQERDREKARSHTHTQTKPLCLSWSGPENHTITFATFYLIDESH